MKKSKLVIGISSRALFDLDESHKIFERDGVAISPEFFRKSWIPLTPSLQSILEILDPTHTISPDFF